MIFENVFRRQLWRLKSWRAGKKGVVELQELPGVTKAGAFCGKNAFPWLVLSLSVCWMAFLSARAKRMETHLPPVCYILDFLILPLHLLLL